MNDLDLDDFVDAAVQKTSITIFNLLDTKGNDCVDFPSFCSFLVDLGLVKNFLGGHNCLNCLRQTFNNIKEKDSEYVTFASLLQHLQQQHIDNTKIDLIPINLISKDISNLIISTAPILSTLFPILTIISNRSTRTASRNKLLQANHIITEYGNQILISWDGCVRSNLRVLRLISGTKCVANSMHAYGYLTSEGNESKEHALRCLQTLMYPSKVSDYHLQLNKIEDATNNITDATLAFKKSIALHLFMFSVYQLFVIEERNSISIIAAFLYLLFSFVQHYIQHQIKCHTHTNLKVLLYIRLQLDRTIVDWSQSFLINVQPMKGWEIYQIITQEIRIDRKEKSVRNYLMFFVLSLTNCLIILTSTTWNYSKNASMMEVTCTIAIVVWVCFTISEIYMNIVVEMEQKNKTMQRLLDFKNGITRDISVLCFDNNSTNNTMYSTLRNCVIARQKQGVGLIDTDTIENILSITYVAGVAAILGAIKLGMQMNGNDNAQDGLVLLLGMNSLFVFVYLLIVGTLFQQNRNMIDSVSGSGNRSNRDIKFMIGICVAIIVTSINQSLFEQSNGSCTQGSER